MNEMPFCTQLALQLEIVNDAIDPVLTSDQRRQVEAVVEIFRRQLECVDSPVGTTAILRVASSLLGEIVSPSSRIAS